jgi:hypothetical protein
MCFWRCLADLKSECCLQGYDGMLPFVGWFLELSQRSEAIAPHYSLAQAACLAEHMHTAGS